jgi:hypothetical protein
LKLCIVISFQVGVDAAGKSVGTRTVKGLLGPWVKKPLTEGALAQLGSGKKRQLEWTAKDLPACLDIPLQFETAYQYRNIGV